MRFFRVCIPLTVGYSRPVRQAALLEEARMSARWAIVVATFLGLASVHIADAGAVETRTGQAVENGSAEAMNRLGILYATGLGVSRDYVAALAWYRRAADNGSTSAMNNI